MLITCRSFSSLETKLDNNEPSSHCVQLLPLSLVGAARDERLSDEEIIRAGRNMRDEMTKSNVTQSIEIRISKLQIRR